MMTIEELRYLSETIFSRILIVKKGHLEPKDSQALPIQIFGVHVEIASEIDDIINLLIDDPGISIAAVSSISRFVGST